MVDTIVDLRGNVILADEFRAPGGGGTAATQAYVLAETKSKTELVATAAVATADATDLATALVLVNALKAKINALLVALKA